MLIPDLRTAVLLGSHENSDEYQVGETLVWICFDAPDVRDACTDAAFRQLPSILAAIPEVIEKAVALLREASPDFWLPHDLAGTSFELVSVWGIWVYPSSCQASYHVSENHDFESPEVARLPILDEGVAVFVARDRNGVLSVER